ncbi:thymidine phosphorylase [Roseicitreum antarcticum]|uniref:thymidine phosphorylase n=1 Tax=Roseicitreum antarcticum TaxID=564137 RepID=A0A1H2RCV9_9RHOB|nr:thymidine phosphorylase [Roseicitreum antarcticum]SDW16499.1 thymidine phosphorylase [Roseicitreum antarcticum]
MPDNGPDTAPDTAPDTEPYNGPDTGPAPTDTVALIDGLRRGIHPDAAALRHFVAGLTEGRVSDAQAGAFAMAVCWRGLGDAGRTALTAAMRDSGQVLRWDLPGPVLDKHSTGGVGDTVSLLLAPALAACGVYVPMISGRGLGHTGGTLDKLDAIPGLRTDQPTEAFRQIVRDHGCAIVAASDSIAPADRRLYALRDVTGTVDSIDLITASILSKKLAAGLDGLILDVKCGAGAFAADLPGARILARALVDTAKGAGCPTTACITDMSQPLSPAMGNALEVAEVLRLLRDPAPCPLIDLTVALGGALLDGAARDARTPGGSGASAAGGALTRKAATGKAATGDTKARGHTTQTGTPHGASGADRLRAALTSGRAAERFAAMVRAMGGRGDVFAPDLLPTAPVILPVPAPAPGYVTAIDGTALGRAVVALGGGRTQPGDRIDPAVGISAIARLGQWVERGDPLAFVHAARHDAGQRAVAAVQAATRLASTPPATPALILEQVI